MVNKIVGFFEAILKLLRSIENVIVDLAAAVAPWLAPIPSAYLTYSHMVGIMEFPIWVGFSAAICIELLGFSAVQTAFSLWSFNQEKRMSDKAAPVLIAIITGGAYLFIVLLLILGLDDAPVNVKAARAGLASLSLIGAIVLALRASHARKLAGIQAEKDVRKAEAAAKKVSQNYNESITKVAETITDWRKLSENEKKELGKLTTIEILNKFPGITESTARRWRRESLELYEENFETGEDNG